MPVKSGGAWHRNHAHRYFSVGKKLLRLQRQRHFGAGGDDDGLHLLALADFASLGQHIGTFADVAQTGLGGIKNVLTAQQQGCWLAPVLQRHAPGDSGLGGIARAPDIQVRDQAQRGSMFDRLVRRAVFTQADRVVREDMHHAQLHQRRHADRVAAVVAEGQKSAAIGNEAAVQRNAVHDRRHAELAHTVVDVATTVAIPAKVEAQVRRTFGVCQIRAGEIGRAAQHFGQGGREGFKRELRGLARSHGFRLGVSGDCAVDGDLVEIFRQLAVHAPHQFLG